MGRLLLIGVIAAALAACDPTAQGPGGGHADLACAECHSGPEGERGRAMVPPSACLECHEDGGPELVQVATVTFPHRDHGMDYEIEPTCAGCHTHSGGDRPLVASVDACALCHVGQVQSADPQQCRLCHERPDHSRLTSQGVAISHSELPWLEIGCVRCHYDVADVETQVAALECRQCHDDLAVLNQQAVGRDLHPIHDGLTCTACHEEGLHEVRAMSSAVELVCSDCHSQAHEQDVALGSWPPTQLCSACHTGVHEPQQRLILGVRAGGDVRPSEHFMGGITCRSCHIPPAVETADPMTPVRGQATACAGCHEEQYVQVLDWWIDGVNARLTASAAYVNRAMREVGGHSETTTELLSSASGFLELVKDAGGQHNLELSDRLIREAVQRSREAYDVAGVAAPAPPELGRVPHSGLCSYCHYRVDEPWDFRTMPEDFHQGLPTRR